MGPLRALKTCPQLVALGRATTQRSSQVLNGHTRLHGRDQGGNLAIDLAQLALQGGVASSRRGVHLLPAGEVFWIGQGGDPFVQSCGHLVFPKIDGARMVTQVHRYGTRLAQLTSVEDARCLLPWSGGTLHAASTCGTEQQPAQRIWHRRFSATHKTRTPPRLHPKSDSPRQLVSDQRFVRSPVRCDPVDLVTPPHASLVPGSDIVGVDQDLVFLLLAPHTNTAVRRVVEDCADRRMGPSARITVPVPRRVILAW
ncbi:hypothetical protein A5658_19220 [Mycobacterium sp. 1245111.1]|nr:hypothetical protein A5658_19220 [Mycobacterium sp. 1245111.1]